MKKVFSAGTLRACALLAALLTTSQVAHAQPKILWEAYNDYRPGTGGSGWPETSPNASTYDLRITGDGGVLRDIATGADLEASVMVEVLPDGVAAPDDFGANSYPSTNSPAFKVFGGKVDVGNAGLPGLHASTFQQLVLHFTGLDPTKRYNFRGTVSRGGSYNDRWSVYTITNADAFVDAHADASPNKNLFTKATFDKSNLKPNQVALNTGENRVGSVVGWDNIEPGADGGFDVIAEQYAGVAPFGNPSAAAYAYGFNAIYLAKTESTGSLKITENPPVDALTPIGKTLTLKVTATSPQAITYQWQRAAAGQTNFTDVAGATQASYTTPVLAASDDGSQLRVKITSGASSTVSPATTIHVDASIPTISAVRGSVNFNAVYVTFSEAMNLDKLAAKTNFTLSGLTISNAVALDPTTVKLVTSPQTPGTRYNLSVGSVSDVAGNDVANGSTSVTAYNVTTNVLGLEIWKNIGGGNVTDLRNNARYPSDPDVDFVANSFDSVPIYGNFDNNTYGGRFRAWLVPDATGDYEFFLRSANGGELRISTDDKFDNMDDTVNFTPDAVDTSVDDPFQEPGIDGSVTVPIHLEKGKRYAVQAIWKEDNGSDYLQVAWRKFGDATPADQLQPIPGKYFQYYGPVASTAVEAKITSIALASGKVTITWTGTALESSDDLKTWTTEAGAGQPFSVTPSAKKKFYRAKS